MAESAELNILIETGADFVMYKTIRDDQENPVDLTGASISSHLREYSEAADYLEFACMHNGPGGKITITMPHETTSQIAYASGVYDVKVVLADGFTTYTLHGEAVIREGVTKFYDGKVLFMVGIGEYDALPEVGNVDRLYLCYEDRKIYRWNGANYIATSVGNGIQKIEPIEYGAAGNKDIYRITYDDGTWFDYSIVNGGISSIEYLGQTGSYIGGLTDHYIINYVLGHQTKHFEFEIHQGYITYAGVRVDLDTGDLVMYTQDGYEGPTFRLDDESGELMQVFD